MTTYPCTYKPTYARTYARMLQPRTVTPSRPVRTKPSLPPYVANYAGKTGRAG